MPPLPAALTSSMLYFQMVIMAGTVMLAYYFEYTDTFTVNVQGFFCHDSAYRKPYPGPEDSSAVPPVLLYSLAAGVPVLVVSPGVLARAPDSHLSPFFSRQTKHARPALGPGVPTPSFGPWVSWSSWVPLISFGSRKSGRPRWPWGPSITCQHQSQEKRV